MRLSVLSFFAGLLCFSTSASQAETTPNKTIKLVTTEMESYISASGDHRGYLVDSVIATFKQAGYEATVDVKSWQDALQALQNGEADGIFPVNAETDNSISVTIPISGGEIVLFKRQNSGELMQLDGVDQRLLSTEQLLSALGKQPLAVVSGSPAAEIVQSHPGLNVKWVDSEQAALQSLLDEEVTWAALDQRRAQFILDTEFSQYHAEQVFALATPIGEQRFYLGLSKKNPEYEQLVAAFDDSATRLARKGEFTRIAANDPRVAERQYV